MDEGWDAAGKSVEPKLEIRISKLETNSNQEKAERLETSSDRFPLFQNIL
jgi:hypothetical protein